MTAAKILEYKLVPRFMMLVMTVMYIRVVEWYMAIPQDVVSTEAAAFVSVVTGAMTGALGLFLNSENKS